jgi:hypothetical protein
MSDLRAVLRFVIPHFTKLRRSGAAAAPIDSAPPDAAERAAAYWKNNEYAEVRRRMVLKWLGIEWFSVPYREGLRSYFFPANDLCDVIEEMQTAGLVPSLGPDSLVFEPGCNVGRNMYWLRKRFHSRLVGMDISMKAIDLAKQDIWKRQDRVEFIVDDVLKTRYFDGLPDDHFDLSFTRWHLIHIPKCPEKAHYLQQLKRVSKVVVILEPVRPEVQGRTFFYQDGRYCLSWDDWASDYGLTRFAARAPLKDSEAVFYHSKLRTG